MDLRTWKNLSSNISCELENLEREIGEVQKESNQRIVNTKNSIQWDWETYGKDGKLYAVYWDDASEEQKAMLDFAAKFNHTWPSVRKKMYHARNLLQEAMIELNALNSL